MQLAQYLTRMPTFMTCNQFRAASTSLHSQPMVFVKELYLFTSTLQSPRLGNRPQSGAYQLPPSLVWSHTRHAMAHLVAKFVLRGLQGCYTRFSPFRWWSQTPGHHVFGRDPGSSLAGDDALDDKGPKPQRSTTRIREALRLARLFGASFIIITLISSLSGGVRTTQCPLPRYLTTKEHTPGT